MAKRAIGLWLRGLLLSLLTGVSVLLVGCGSPPTEMTSPLAPPVSAVLEATATRAPATGVGVAATATPASATPIPTTPAAPVVTPTEAASAMPAGALAIVAKARQDLAQRLDIHEKRITVLMVEAVEWRDSSLGCAKPGREYLMVITPGYLIRFEASGRIYEYHTDNTRAVLCDEPEPPLGLVRGPEEHLVAAAKADLAQRLGIDSGQIELLQLEKVKWPDASLGCPQPGVMYAQVITPGYRILLSAQAQAYDYRANGRRVLLCRD